MANNPEPVSQVVQDWWPFAAFLLSGAAAFLVGRERQRWRINEIGKEQQDQGKRIAALEAQGTAEAKQLAEIHATQKMILVALEQIQKRLDSKADK